MASEKKPGEGIFQKLKWLDPFTYVDLYVMPKVNPKGDKLIENVVYVFFALIFAYVLYNFVLAGLFGTSAPLVIVYSGSMEPVLYRGDVVLLSGAKSFEVTQVDINFPVAGRRISEYAQLGVQGSEKFGIRQAALKIGGKEYLFDPKGPIVVYYSSQKRQDIIHRAVLLLHAPDGDFLVTQGDSINNSRIDQDCVGELPDCISLYPIAAKDVRGQHILHIPLIGYVKLLIFDDLPKLLLR